VCVPTQILPSLKVRQVAAGGMHSVALTMEGEVRSLSVSSHALPTTRSNSAGCPLGRRSH
jgi:alpha-tubulin suppressor-like RCC1 family protein